MAPEPNFSDATLVIVAHGSTVNAESAVPARQHAADIRNRGIFAQVLEGFWKQEPYAASVLQSASTTRVFVVPLFISEGYFASEVIPRELGFASLDGTPARYERVLKRTGQTLYYCDPVGTHSSMTQAILGRATEILQRYPFPRAPKPRETTLLIAGHGTNRNENSRMAIERQVERIRGLDLYAAVHAVFMEEEPRISDWHTLAEARNVIVVPFFISDGMHSHEDIPVLLGEPERIVKARLASGQPTWRNPTEKKGKLVWYTSAIGTEPHIADVIIQRAREAALLSI